MGGGVMRSRRVTRQSTLRVAAALSVILAAGLGTSSGGDAVAADKDIGAITEYPIPTASSLSFYIAAGPDGNIWFTESGTYKVAKVTRVGIVTEYALPSGTSPQGIVAGPDGNLWFTGGVNGAVAKVTTSGVFTEYPAPTAIYEPTAIAAGPDGNLWFTE